MQSVAKIIKNNFADISIGFAFWALLIIRFGYCFGTGDQSEFTPYALYLADNSLYKTDLFIQKLAENPVNERIFFCSALSVFSKHLELLCFLGHLLFTVLLVIGLLKICRLFIQNQFYSYFIIFTLLVLSAGILPGGATMYSNSFLADSVAHAFTVWGVYYALKHNLLRAVSFLIPATLIHPLIGLFVTLLVLGGYLFHMLFDRKMLWDKKLLLAVGLYLFTAGIYLILLFPQEAKTLTDEAYFRIFFELRYPHHTLPSHFSRFGLAALMLFAISGLYYFYNRQRTIFWFLLLQCSGFVIYTVAIETFHIVEIGLSQWFRSSMWTYFLGLIALASMVENRLRIFIKPGKIFYAASFLFFIATITLFFINPYMLPLKNAFEIGSYKHVNEAIVISEKIRQKQFQGTFILPFNFTAHKYYSGQSSFVDYKTIPRKNANLSIWYNRMKLVYDVDTAHHLKGFEAETKANAFYRNLPDSNLKRLKTAGVNYMIADTLLKKPQLQMFFSYGKYSVYRLK